MAIKLKITHGTYSAEGTSATIKCNGKKLSSDIVIEAVEVADVALISFTIDGTTYYSPEGWKWEQWVADTKYNTGGYIVSDRYIKYGSEYVVTTASADTMDDCVLSSNSIIPSFNYYLSGGTVLGPSTPGDSAPK